MTKTEFAGFIREHGPVILDGATGTNLMEAGMPIGVCPESWVLENPQVLLDLQRRYVEAGSHIVYASTFTGNRIKLEEYGLQERLEEINTQLVALSRQAVGDQALVAGDMTMTGQQLFPMGAGIGAGKSRGGPVCGRNHDESAGMSCGSDCDPGSL